MLKFISTPLLLQGHQMKNTLFILAIFFGVLSQALAQDSNTEEQCKIFVEQTVKSLADQSKRYGEDTKIDDLSEEKILDLQLKNGSCFAMKEINLRLHPK
ncbi:MAG: hypothetical protein B7Y56_03805 [Gallionellales bacterium 35-53-114]|nr:MAG: hypothetical protein B7Y56_03805 [Gallionellales bacterium 35-53-114]OZB08131.1 MAG: hypothetical protein B7X61_11415 [Gallionellales bacterium 39-52-133]